MEQVTWEEAMRRGRVAMEEWLKEDQSSYSFREPNGVCIHQASSEIQKERSDGQEDLG